jgi:hypothetical protein
METSLARSYAMDNKKLLMGTAILGLGVAALAEDAEAINTNVNIQARIFANIVLTATRTLDFGILNVSGGASTGTVNVDNTGTRTVGGAGGLIAAGGTPSEGGIKITAQAASTLVVTVPASATIKGGGDTMTVKAFTITGNAGPTFTLPAWTGAQTTDTVAFGGTLNGTGSNLTGTYTGTFSVGVNYQ